MAAIIARLSAANWARKQRNRDKRKIPPEKSNRILPPFDQCYDPEKHNRYLRVQRINEHRNHVLATAKEICHQLQKDDDEWCYFMRYGKPRRNHMIPDLSKGKNLVELSKPPHEREPDEHGKSYQRVWQEAENRQRKKFWQCVYAALSLTCVSVFIAILLFLFFIFHNLDNKPWTSIFPNLFYENN